MQRTQTNPRAETVPVLRVVVAKEGGMTNSYELVKDYVRFGRSPECEVRLEGKNISRVHCILEARADGLWVRDNDSLNGIFVNGEKVREAIVTARDAVKVGPYRFKAIIASYVPASSRPVEKPQAVVPANDAAFDKTEAAFTRGSDPLPKEEPLRTKTSSSAGAILEDFIPVIPGNVEGDRTPADGTPVATPADGLPKAVQAAVVPPAPLPSIEKPSYRSSFEAKKSEPAPAPAPAPAPVKAEAPRAPAATKGGRFSLTNNTKKEKTLRAGDTCPSCYQGSMLTWQGGLQCRKCKHTGTGAVEAKESSNEIAKSEPKLESKLESKIEAKAPIANESREVRSERTPAPGAKRPAAVRAGSLCPECSDGRMYTWQGGLMCRKCKHTSEQSSIMSSTRAAVVTQQKSRPSIAAPAREATPAPIAAKAPVAAPVARPAAPAPVVAKAPEAPIAKPVVKADKAESAPQLGELCGNCYKGHYLAWQGGLRCRVCGTTTGAAAQSAKAPVAAKAPSAARAPVQAKAITNASSSTLDAKLDREPKRGVGVAIGVGGFVALYGTIIASWVIQVMVIAAMVAAA